MVSMVSMLCRELPSLACDIHITCPLSTYGSLWDDELDRIILCSISVSGPTYFTAQSMQNYVSHQNIDSIHVSV